MAEDLLRRTEGMQYYYPGVWTEREKPYLEAMLADFQKLAERGPIDVEKLISGTLPEGTPGVGATVKVTKEVMENAAKIYDPDNPLYFDADYAAKTRFGGVIAYPTISCHDDFFVIGYPGPARDAMLVSGLDHTNIFHRPVYEGDTLYLVADSHDVYDMTPEGGDYFRTLCFTHKGSIYNQKGELVSEVIWRMGESGKAYLNPPPKPANARPGPPPMLEVDRKPEHYYTDADYEMIMEIWKNEKRRGSEPLYWEDVQIGERPTPTADGPTLRGNSPSREWIGTGSGGVPSLRKEILDPEQRNKLARDEQSGVYYPKDAEIPRRGFSGINLVTRDYAIRHISNWMGDSGWIARMDWSVRNWDETYGPLLPDHPEAKHWLSLVPELGKTTSCGFPLTYETYLIKSQVVNKYIKNGKFYVELVLWHTSINRDICMEALVTVELPSKNGGQ